MDWKRLAFVSFAVFLVAAGFPADNQVWVLSHTTGYCTLFNYHKDDGGRVFALTAYHCLDDQQEPGDVHAKVVNPYGGDVVAGSVTYHCARNDVAVVSYVPNREVSLVAVDSRQPSPEDKVFMVGAVAIKPGKWWAMPVSWGTWTGRTSRWEGGDEYVIIMDITKGQSGSPVFHADSGRAFGVAVSAYEPNPSSDITGIALIENVKNGCEKGRAR